MRTIRDDLERSADGGRGTRLARLAPPGAERPVPGPAGDLLAGIAQAAPYLGRLMRRADLPALLSRGWDGAWEEVMADAVRPRPAGDVRAGLRAAKRDAHLLLALGDLSGVWETMDVTGRLSDFADACVEAGLRAAWEEAAAHRKAALALPPSGPVPGLAAIAMGKLGAGELNYSSDIDLVMVYDADRLPLGEGDRRGVRETCNAVVRGLLSVLSDQTPNGYVFRTDLRLRPDPGSTAPAVSLGAAERYYEQYGQTWERAAHIKARPCAGDRATGAAYLSILRPFVWRRTLDYAAIADIEAIKRQIHAKVGSPEVRVAGGDVKLGPGGIREVEFFAQTQQLILGGRNEALRAPRTVDALGALAAAGQVEGEAADALSAAYLVLRDVEHRIQMTQDAPDQTVPEADEARVRLATLMGDDLAGFDARVLGALRAVHDRYAELFGPPAAEEIAGSLVFTGVDDDPRTLATLSALGFAEPARVARTVRGWHQGDLPAARSLRAREVLTGLVPRLLQRASGTGAGEPGVADDAFAAVDGFLRLLPAGLQLFSLLAANPDVLDDVVTLCAASPAIARSLGRRPRLVEELLDGAGGGALRVPPGAGLEATMDAVRRHASGERLRRAAELTLGRGDPYGAGEAMSDLADGCVRVLSDAVRDDMGDRAGPPLAVIAFGRHGARSLTVRSDLDLVFVYDGDPAQSSSALRRVRRLVAALSAPTAEGVLYEVDMKLRPSGGQGPAAVSLGAFERYYDETARLWEFMALTKARLVHAEGGLGAEIDRVLNDQAARRRDPGSVAAEVSDMRGRLLAGHPPRGPLDVKRMRGGLTDVDFVAQSLTLRAGPGARHRSTPDALRAHVAAGRLEAGAGAKLLAAHRLYEATLHYARATFSGPPPDGLQPMREARLAALAGVPPGEAAQRIGRSAEAVLAIFEASVGPYPAG